MEKVVQIPKPCHENWSAMTPAEKGRHCGVCDKVVVDFSSMSNEKILEHLKQSSSEVCGRFNVNQVKDGEKSAKKIMLHPRWKSLGWVASLLSFFSIGIMKSSAQRIKGEVQMLGGAKVSPDYQQDKTLHILVKDSLSGQALNGAKVVFNASFGEHAATTGEDGKADLLIPGYEISSENITLTISYEGKIKTVKNIYIYKQETHIRVLMPVSEPIEMPYEIMGMIVPLELEPPPVIDTTPVVPEEIIVPEADTSTAVPNKILTDTGNVETVHPEFNYVQVFPNPSRGIFQFRYDARSMGDLGWEVFSITGEKILSGNASGELSIDMSAHPSGNYIIVFKKDGVAVESKTIILEK